MRRCMIVLSLLTLLTSYGCNGSSTTYSATDGTILGANTNCGDRADFGDIDENVPTNEVTVSSPIHFRWYYRPAVSWPHPSDWSDECVPTSFTLYLSPGPFFNTVISFPVVPFTVDVNPSSLMYHFYLNDPLQPGTSYRWMVVGHADGIDIDDDQLPLLHDDFVWLTGTMSGLFQTPQAGPACTTQTIGPANLIYPQDGAVLPDDTPYFQWDMPNCSSEAYHIMIDTEPQMASPYMGWVTNKEGLLIHPNQLQNCTTYYWQVEAGVYSIEYHMNSGGWATISDVWEFTTDFQGNCNTASDEVVEIFAIGCIGKQSMMVSFEFSEPAKDIYEARVEGNVYACELNAERPRLLHCSGLRTEIVSSGLVELVVIETDEIVYSREERFPNCEDRGCSGLSSEECTLRSDCTWVSGRAGSAGFCQDS